MTTQHPVSAAGQEAETSVRHPAGQETETFGTPAPGLHAALLAWYDRYRRHLPWREDPTAYHVWVSEIMLQQTRVEAVRGYYARFMERFPDIRSLAESEEDECLKLWEGLGYYSRARNLRRAAGVIMDQYGGEMPRTAGELRKLPGIGPYTSAAIASIAFGERIPAVDGNLLRVFARLALYEKEIKTPAASKAAEDFFLQAMPQERPGDFNQALMDLGAGVCIPGGTPACQTDGECPLRDYCGACRTGRCGDLPVMPVKKARRIEHRTVLVIRDDDNILLRRRPAKGLLAGLYEFPNEEGWMTEAEALDRAESYGCMPAGIRRLPDARHVFTHLEWHMRGYEIRSRAFSDTFPDNTPVAGHSPETGGCFAAPLGDLRDKYAIPGALAAFSPADPDKDL